MLGMLKTGRRKLFYRDYSGKCIEMDPVCLLDFYVHESCQRLGIGKKLFDMMLEHEDVMPNKVAYDRPSNLLLNFLKKYFGLSNYDE